MSISRELTLKNLKPLFLIVIVLILTAISAYPQRKFTGRVVEVLDGKTFVIQLQSGKITALLQYIEIPEPEQPLRQTVKEHLEAIILNQNVEFKPLGLIGDRAAGQLFLKGVDVGQQMIRDGAAWHAPLESNGQTEADRESYESNQTQAKAEKRGIWGIDNLKPAWEFRAEKITEAEVSERLEYEKRKEIAASTAVTVRRPPTSQPSFADFEAWSDVRKIDSSAGVGGLITRNDPANRFGYILTTQAKINVAGAPNPPYLDFRVAYVYRMLSQGKDSVYVIGILVDADEYKFAKSNSLTVFADRQKIELGGAYRFSGDTGAAKRETLVYKITRSALQKIAGAKAVSVKVGTFSGAVSEKLQPLVKNLLNSSE